ncbi:DUF4240 domain-containing protein [Nonomuraea sp. NN258]|uniref:DUF4240 domain-containing protein n=1 Tax=Nonomuraea antri TaxID=2730852 RepID=UPI001569024C|nr:DUF4240 domain-containing protein [Nonomuraea antri]NRQ37289.1 DUF4240 domain-containing protein [Nonomuraea antri]
MNLDEFWSVVDSARTDAEPTDEALVDRLAALPMEEILDFQERFDEVADAVHRWDVWAAAYLIGGGCSNDSFSDFRAGLIALGRGWFESAAQSPDNLAGHPAVIEAAAQGRSQAIFYEKVQFAAKAAYERHTDGDVDAFYKALAVREEAAVDRATGDDMGEDFDFDDAQLRQRLPRLSALFLPAG